VAAVGVVAVVAAALAAGRLTAPVLRRFTTFP
jgi:hypothetical protein